MKSMEFKAIFDSEKKKSFFSTVLLSALVLIASPAYASSKKQPVKKTVQQGLKAEMAPALGSGSNSDDAYNPNATSWPIKRPAFKGRVAEDGALSAGSSFTDSIQKSKSYLVKPGANKPVFLTGGVEENVPRTPEDVSKYLIRMKAIINQYDRLVASTLMGSTGLNVDEGSMSTARDQTQVMISKIRTTIPPTDLKETHDKLAGTLAEVQSLLSGGVTGFDALTKCMSLTTEIHSTMDGYHDGVLKCIAHYGLDPSLDPFSDEDPNLKSKFAQESEQFKKQRVGEFRGRQESAAASGAGSGSDLGSLLGGSGLGALLGGGGAGAGSGLGALMGSGGSSPDLGQLMKLLPGLLGGQGGTQGIDPSSLMNSNPGQPAKPDSLPADD